MTQTKVTSDLITSVDASKLTGTLPASMATDTTPIENDLAVLALQNAVNSNITAHGLQNSWIEQFEDSSAITLTDCARNRDEYISSTVPVANHTVTLSGNVARSSAEKKFGSYSAYFQSGSYCSIPDSNDWDYGSGDFTEECWVKPSSDGLGQYTSFWTHKASTANSYGTHVGGHSSASSNLINVWVGTTWVITGGAGQTWSDGWRHLALVRHGSSTYFYINGVDVASTNSTNSTINNNTSTFNIGGSRYSEIPTAYDEYNGYIDSFRVSKGIARYPSGTTFTPPTEHFTADSYTKLLLDFEDTSFTDASGLNTNATGSFTSNTITPQDSASKSSLGLVLLYKNNAGTNTLNTDVICKVSADNGSNYSTCVLASKGTFSTGINIAIAPAISVTSGNQLKYKVEFANQSSGSKEAQIHGVALQY